jgi:signal transduction histidine kinase
MLVRKGLPMSDQSRPPSLASAPAEKRPSSPAAEPATAAIAELEAELVACQRLAVLGNMAAMVAHEFNNLLTPIMARAEAALASGDDVAYMRKALERALIQSQRAMTVTRHLLGLAQDQPRPVEACAVAAAVREAVETMTRPLEKDGIELRVTVPDDLWVTARADLFCQVLLNLLLNARQAMQGMRGPLAVTAAFCDGQVQIDVRDSGRGIPHDQLVRVLNPFLAADPYQRPNDWQPIGLGLNVCRLIARHHGAILQALANDDRGCTFRLCWPAARPAPAPASTDQQAQQQPGG